MSKELQAQYTTGSTVYAVLLNGTGSVWNGSAFASLAVGSWTTYAITMTEESTTGIYAGTFPTLITSAGRYSYLVYLRAGASAAATDTLIWSDIVSWSGSAATVPVVANSTGLVTLAAVTHTGAVIPTITTYTGNTPQTGDSYARIGALGVGLTAVGLATSEHTLIAADTQTGLTAQGYTTTRAGYLDNINPASPTAAAIATYIFDTALIETGVTFRQAMKYIGAATVGTLVEPVDRSSTAIAAMGNAGTPRLASTNSNDGAILTRTVSPIP